MKKLQSEVVTLITNMGEIIGRLKTYDDDGVTLINPRLFVNSQEGMGFMPSLSMTSEPQPEEAVFNKTAIITVLKTQEDVEKAWRQAVSGIIVQ